MNDPHVQTSTASSPSRARDILQLTQEDALRVLRQALHPNDMLSALQAIGLDCSDLAEGIGVDERTVRRWLDGRSPNRNHEKTIGALRILTIHMLQRGGLPVELVARWLRLPDGELGFIAPLTAVAEGRLSDVVVAYDAYLVPRPGTSSQQREEQEDQPVEDMDSEAAMTGAVQGETGEFSVVGAGG